MNTTDILSALDSEISRLTQVRKLLLDVGQTAAPAGDTSSRKSKQIDAAAGAPKRGPGRPKGSTNKTTTSHPSEPARKRTTMSAEGRARIAAAQRARWAKRNQSVTSDAKSAAKSSSAKQAAKRNVAPANKAASKTSASGRKVGRPRKGATSTASAEKAAKSSTAGKQPRNTGRPQSKSSKSSKSASKRTSDLGGGSVPSPETLASA